ncbi:MAG: hypothetical protein QM756_15830 [Polyangiaceae bacterium]
MAEAAVAVPHRVREYETIYVLKPDVGARRSRAHRGPYRRGRQP